MLVKENKLSAFFNIEVDLTIFKQQRTGSPQAQSTVEKVFGSFGQVPLSKSR